MRKIGSDIKVAKRQKGQKIIVLVQMEDCMDVMHALSPMFDDLFLPVHRCSHDKKRQDS
jgi:hypothetical protein